MRYVADGQYTFTKDYKMIIACASDNLATNVNAKYVGDGIPIIDNYKNTEGAAYVFSALSVITNVKSGDSMKITYNGMIWSIE